MPRAQKTMPRRAGPDAVSLRELTATADPTITPSVMPSTGREIINRRVPSSLIDELNDVAEAEPGTREAIVTRTLANARHCVAARDLGDRTPKKRHWRTA